jgi:hypothetical protein
VSYRDDAGAVDLVDVWCPDVSAFGARWLSSGTAQRWSEAVDIAYTPHRWQAYIHDRLKRFSVVPCHRRFGKTVLAINGLVRDAAAFAQPDGRFGYVAPFRSQAKDVAWLYLKRYTANLPGMVPSESELFVEFANAGGHKSRIRLYGADNANAIRGIYFDGVVIDEVADMAADVWGEIIRPMLIDRRGWALFIGTPKGVNLFSQLYYFALDKMRAGDAEWYAESFPDSRTKLTPADELLSLRGTDDQPGSMTETQFRQEYECDFSASNDNVLITVDVVTRAFKRFMVEADYRLAPRILGVDVARYGSDRSVVFRRQGLMAHEPKIFTKADNMSLAGSVARMIDDWQPDAVFIDAGRGEGVIDRLRQLKYPVVEVQFGGSPLDTHYQNKRAEMWDTMARWIASGGVLPNNEALRTDLCAPTYTYKNAAGKFELESKDSMRKRLKISPDMGDALALTFAYPVAGRRATTALGGSVMLGPAVKKDWDYDPHARAEAEIQRDRT